MNDVFVIILNINVDYEGTRTSIIAVRDTTESDVIIEVESLNKKLFVKSDEFSNTSYSYFKTTTVGYSAINVEMDDIDIQKNTLKRNFENDKFEYVRFNYKNKKNVIGINYRDFLAYEISCIPLYNLIKKDDIFNIYDQYIEENIFKIIDSI